MNIISLDVHKEVSQLAVFSEATGEVFLEMKVPTTKDDLRKVIGGISSPKRVIFEEGPMSAMIQDALEGVADEIISCDPTRNALIARSEDSNDERDARRLITLDRAGAIKSVYVPPEPYRTLRSLLIHDRGLRKVITGAKNRIKALCRRNVIRCRGAKVYRSANRKEVLEKLPNSELRWQMKSLYRQLDMLRKERVGTQRMLGGRAGRIKEVECLESIPGIKGKLSKVIAAWICNPTRFKSRNALSSYAGLGLGQGFTNWKPVGRAHASKRGNRELKRALFLAAQAAIKSKSNLSRRYDARIAAGWEAAKAKRDIARKILFIASKILKTGREYNDDLVSVPEIKHRGR